MDNASQALLIAGGILIAILVISLFPVLFNNMAKMQNAEADVKEAKRLADWNESWEVYNKDYLYGTDILTVINKAIEDNTYTVEIVLNNTTVVQDGKLLNPETKITIRKTGIYKCEGMERNNENGRINKIIFTETSY